MLDADSVEESKVVAAPSDGAGLDGNSTGEDRAVATAVAVSPSDDVEPGVDTAAGDGAVGTVAADSTKNPAVDAEPVDDTVAGDEAVETAAADPTRSPALGAEPVEYIAAEDRAVGAASVDAETRRVVANAAVDENSTFAALADYGTSLFVV